MTELLIISAVVVLLLGLYKALPPALRALWDVLSIKRKNDMEASRVFFDRLQATAGEELMTLARWMAYPAWVFVGGWLYGV